MDKEDWAVDTLLFEDPSNEVVLPILDLGAEFVSSRFLQYEIAGAKFSEGIVEAGPVEILFRIGRFVCSAGDADMGQFGIAFGGDEKIFRSDVVSNSPGMFEVGFA